jgi:Trk-type K+ transport system membrane component
VKHGDIRTSRFAVITLSLLVMGLAIIGISYFDSEMSLLSIAFECFSAYSTGLSIGLYRAILPGAS